MTKQIKIGNVILGNGHIVIQSMTDTKTEDARTTLKQIEAMYEEGAELVRVTVNNEQAADAIKEITRFSPVPIIADVHFDGRLAVKAIENGALKIRINPSNLPESHFKNVIAAAKEHQVAVRIGVNRGSDFNHTKSAEAMVEACLTTAKRFEDQGFERLVLCVKSSDVKETVLATRLLRKKTNYPIHIGLTESGTELSGLMKSSAAIGSLLLDGIGDTVRISLSEDPIKEVRYARRLLTFLGLRSDAVEVISCPTCGRTEFDVKNTAKAIEDLSASDRFNCKIAVMGCVVNGIGESKNADFGVAGGKNRSVIFKNGKELKTVDNAEVLNELKLLLQEAKENASK